MELTYFSDRQSLLFLISFLLLLVSVITFHREKRKAALLFLFFSSLGFGFFIAGLDNFLIIWDEQYHALVAKHLIDNPLKPTLYSKPLLDYDYRNWTGNYIWLHKQPLFLWQMALSLKLFGINELAVRIPSIVLHAIATIMVYRIGKISYNATVGYYGALFFAVSYYLLELVAGKYPTDHNDVAFLFYVTASFWSWYEYQNSRKGYWIIIIGVFAGCAVLVKWLMGLLIYPVWVISLGINDKMNRLKIKSYLPVLKSFVISLLIILPWQIFIYYRYPKEAKYEWQLMSEHFFRPIENHSGNIWFHFHAIRDIYGSGQAVPFLLLIGLFIFLRNSKKLYRVAGLSAIIIIYTFYSLAATKMTSFSIIAAPFGFLALGALTALIIEFLKSKIKFRIFHVVFPTIAVIVVCYFLINISKIQNYHTDWKPQDNCNRKADLEQMTLINEISDGLKGDNWAVFNSDVRLNGHIEVMFYTDFFAYGFIPNPDQIQQIKNQSYKIAILDKDDLPDYIIQDNDIVKIKLN